MVPRWNKNCLRFSSRRTQPNFSCQCRRRVTPTNHQWQWRKFGSELVARRKVDLLWIQSQRKLAALESSGFGRRSNPTHKESRVLRIRVPDGNLIYYTKEDPDGIW